MKDAGLTTQRVLRVLGVVFTVLGLMFLSLAVGSATFGLLNPRGLPVLVYIWVALGAPFFVLGVGFLVWTTLSARRRRALLAEGVRLEAEVVALEASTLRINRQQASVLVIAGRHPQSGAALQFRSEPLLADQSWLGTRASVWVDRSDAERYVIEVHGPVAAQA
jgi:hypothetical protein